MFLALLLCVVLFAAPGVAGAATFTLTNGDRVTGEVVAETDGSLSVRTQALGLVMIDKAFLKTPAAAPKKEKAPKAWKGEAAVGYEKNTGNTRDSSLTTSFSLTRKRAKKDETTLKGRIEYSSSGGKMHKQKWYGMTRYARSLGKEKKRYDFYIFEADHDRFQAVDYRFTPAVGLGYWFSDADDFKAMAECGLGVQHTHYNDGTKDDTEPILTPRLYLEKALWGASRLTEELKLYPSVGDPGVIRLRSETSFINPVNDTLSLKLSLIEEYDSEPESGVKKNDLCFTSGLVYSF